MSKLAVFDTTVQKSYEWLHDVRDGLGVEDTRSAYAALRATLHALRDHLQLNEAVQLGAQLPMLLRGLYYEGWRPSRVPPRPYGADEFLEQVFRELRDHPEVDDIEDAVTVVFGVLATRLDGGEIEQAIAQLPKGVRALWPV
ncbi:MAG: DUF2267 domain-containing protein [Rhodospirillales bacterium]|nr:DUF2267 domain-containing protein [Rhodospirillales bacterium]